jgi:DNA/RNA-binding domain of Phe-tRNA-synthetase-like protein
MFEAIKKRVPVDIIAEEPRRTVSMECDRYTCLTTTKKECSESLQIEVEEEEEEASYLDLDFKEENIVQAMVYSEIFGKPKSKRRKRR